MTKRRGQAGMAGVEQGWYANAVAVLTGEPELTDRIQKPQAFYILQRSTLNFDELNRAETFIPKVEKSVEKNAF